MAALAGLAGGFIGGQLAEPDDPTAATVPSVTNEAPTGPVETLPAGEEPVAAAAAVVAPAVVQLETNGGLGSGVIYDNDGHVLTAAHVVAGASAVRVRLADGRTLEGTVVGTDASTDVAVVQIEGASDLPVATLATGEQVQVGQMAIAVGSPFGLDQTVTSGIISALDRSVPTSDGAVSMLQTDAPINPGNSGGALADRRGRVIGINDAIRTDTGANAGVGFAIPIDIAKSVADRLVAGEPIEQGFLGVTSSNGSGGGVLIVEVLAGSPADAAGLERGDEVVAVDGDAIEDPIDLVARIRARQPGDRVTITVERNGERRDVAVVLGAPD